MLLGACAVMVTLIWLGSFSRKPGFLAGNRRCRSDCLHPRHNAVSGARGGCSAPRRTRRRVGWFRSGPSGETTIQSGPMCSPPASITSAGRLAERPRGRRCGSRRIRMATTRNRRAHLGREVLPPTRNALRRCENHTIARCAQARQGKRRASIENHHT